MINKREYRICSLTDVFVIITLLGCRLNSGVVKENKNIFFCKWSGI